MVFFVAVKNVANICYKFFIRALIFIFHVAIRNKDCVKKNQLDKLQRQKILIFIFPIYNHSWRNISTMYVYI